MGTGSEVWTYDIDEELPDISAGVLWPVRYRPMTADEGGGGGNNTFR